MRERVKKFHDQNKIVFLLEETGNCICARKESSSIAISVLKKKLATNLFHFGF